MAGMVIHDWSAVPAGVFHHLHGTWLFELAGELNEGILPDGYYALGEQVAGGVVPDVLTLARRPRHGRVSEAPEAAAFHQEPTAKVVAVAEEPRYPVRPRSLAIRHVSDDKPVAMVEIVSPGNKKEATELGALIEKTVTWLSMGIHVVLVDLQRPGTFDPDGLHNAVWRELGQEPTPFDPGRPLTVVSYAAGRRVKAYVEPLAVGDELPEIPLFLTLDRHVRLPLATSYRTAFARLPEHLRSKLAP
jgi:hypothetical protein